MISLTPEQKDTLTELINIGIGRAAASLNTMVEDHIQLQVPHVELIPQDQVHNYFPADFQHTSSVVMPFTGALEGNATLLFPMQSAVNLVCCLTGEEESSADMDDLKAGTLTEVGNILINAVMGSLSNCLQINLDYAVPDYMEGDITRLITVNPVLNNHFLVAETTFYINNLQVKGSMVLFFRVQSFDILLQKLEQAMAL